MSGSAPSWVATLLEAKQVLVFDWDGTLFDSMAAKTRSFGEVVARHIGGKTADLTPGIAEARYRALSGRPRLEIFDAIAADYGLSLTSTERERMSAELTARNSELLKDAPLFDDARALLETVAQGSRALFISSSVPQLELSGFVDRALPSSMRARFAGVFGSAPGFSKGREHLNYIMGLTGSPAARCLVLGDDPADVELARTAGVDGVLIDRQGRHPGLFAFTLPSFDAVRECLR